uniref:F-box domain-containing protein n=1 Tax=Steinernema glaseri TaxID=37863 RepID=A0A1I8A9P2_9BILA
MDSLPLLFWDHLASQLEEKDLTKMSSELSARCAFTKVSRMHLQKRQKLTLVILRTEGGEWEFGFGQDPKRRLADLPKYEYVEGIVVHTSSLYRNSYGRFTPYCNTFFWKGSLEKILRILPKYVRRPVLNLCVLRTLPRGLTTGKTCLHPLEYDEEVIEKFFSSFSGTSLSKVPFSAVFIPHVGHHDEEFLRRQVSLRCLQRFDINGRSPPYLWDCTEELIRQPQVKYVSIANVREIRVHIVRSLFRKWKTSKFSFEIEAKTDPDLALEEWSTGLLTIEKREGTAHCGTRFKELELSHPTDSCKGVHLSKFGEKIYASGYYVGLWD